MFDNFFAHGWASGLHQRLRAGVRRVWSSWWPILQTAMAASAAWCLATLVLGHEQPFVAAIAAVISLGATAGRGSRRATEWVLGVAFGLAVADLIVLAIGTGTLQIGIVVALAMAAAVFLGAGPLLVTEAGVSALLVATLDPSTVGPTPDRFLDALIGSSVALAVHWLLPVDPKTMVEQAAARSSRTSRGRSRRRPRRSPRGIPRGPRRRSGGHAGSTRGWQASRMPSALAMRPPDCPRPDGVPSGASLATLRRPTR